MILHGKTVIKHNILIHILLKPIVMPSIGFPLP